MVVIVSMAAFRSFSFHISLGNGYVHFPKGRSLAISRRQPLNASSATTSVVGAATTDAIFLGDDTNSATFCKALARSPLSVVTTLFAVTLFAAVGFCCFDSFTFIDLVVAAFLALVALAVDAFVALVGTAFVDFWLWCWMLS